jgi:hypothetical protein
MRSTLENANALRVLRECVQLTYDEVVRTGGHPLEALLRHIARLLTQMGDENAIDHADAEISRLTKENANLRMEINSLRLKYEPERWGWEWPQSTVTID